MADWLSPETARALLELEPLPEDPNDPDRIAWDGALDAATEWVEDKRADVFVDGDPGARVKLGTAMLAHRWYQRRSSPMGTGGYAEFGADATLRHDPDIAKLLGIGTAGRFVFGAAGHEPAPVEPVVTGPEV